MGETTFIKSGSLLKAVSSNAIFLEMFSLFRWNSLTIFNSMSLFDFFLFRRYLDSQFKFFSFLAMNFVNDFLSMGWVVSTNFLFVMHISWNFMTEIFTFVLKFTFSTSSVIRQNGESRNGCNKKGKHTKFSKQRTFLTHWYAHVRNVRFSENLVYFAFLLPPFWDSPFCVINDNLFNFNNKNTIMIFILSSPSYNKNISAANNKDRRNISNVNS